MKQIRVMRPKDSSSSVVSVAKMWAKVCNTVLRISPFSTAGAEQYLSRLFKEYGKRGKVVFRGIVGVGFFPFTVYVFE